MRQRRDLFLFIGIAAALAAFHAFKVREWVRTDAQPPGWDTSVHLGTAMDYREAWKDGRPLDLLRTKARPGHPRYPPLYHYTAAPLVSLPRPHASVAWLNLGYFLALVLSLAWIVYRLGGIWASLAALVVAGLSPQLLFEYREAFPDTGLALWVCLAYALFLRSDSCSRRSWSVGFGLAVGLAMLTRWSTIIYLFPAVVAGALRKESRRNLLLAGLAAAVVCAPWYFFNTVQMIPQIWVSTNIGHEQGLPRVWSWRGLTAYWRELILCYSWAGMLLMLCGALLALRRGWRRAGWADPAVLISAWLGFSMAFITLVPNKHWRYFMPAAAALPAVGLAGLPAPALPAAALIALWHARKIRKPDPAAWPLEDILRTIDARRDHGRGPASLNLLVNHRNMNANNLGWLARHAGLGGVFVGGHQTDIPEWTDFVLLKTGDPGVFMSELTHAIRKQALTGEKPFSLIFQEARRWPLADGSEAVLYEQRGRPPLIRRLWKSPLMRVRSAGLEGIRLAPAPERDGAYELSVATITLGKLGLPVRDMRASLEGARLAEIGGGVRVLGLRKLTLSSARVRWDELSRGLSSRARLPVSAWSEDGAVCASVRLGPLSAKACAEVEAGNGRLRLRGRKLRLAGVPVPGVSLLRWETVLGARLPNQPYDIDLAPLRLSAEEARIGDLPTGT